MGFFSRDNFGDDDASDALGFVGSVVLKRMATGGEWTKSSEFTDLFFLFCKQKNCKPSFIRSNKLVDASRRFAAELIADNHIFSKAEVTYSQGSEEEVFEFNCSLCIVANNFLIKEGLIK